MDIEFIDHSDEVLAAFEAATLRALEKCGLVAEGHAKTLCPVDLGTLRNSISHKLDADAGEVVIGTNVEYAAYVELGTGKYYHGGRQTPWAYQDEKIDQIIDVLKEDFEKYETEQTQNTRKITRKMDA